MSILQNDLPSARVLDLFSGSGALGLEALSRGAAHATFVESSRVSLEALTANIAQLGAGDSSTVERTDALRFATALGSIGAALQQAGDPPFDVAFADPPYRKSLGEQLATLWLARPFSRILSVEHAASETMPGDPDTRRYGATALSFYRV